MASTCPARRAGSQQATKAIAMSRSVVLIKMQAPLIRMPGNPVARIRETPNAPSSPMVEPKSASFSPEARTMRLMFSMLAPKARRMANSPARWAIVRAITP